MEKKELSSHEKLVAIQQELNAPKNQYNKFGKYYYRSCEDIYEAVKPLLKKYNCTLRLSDMIIREDERYYVMATAMLDTGDNQFINTAYAREAENKAGNDASQITGAASSYARKYALNGLFLIDDVKDADATNKHGKEEKEPVNQEVMNGNVASFIDDYFFKHKDELPQFLEKYKANNIQDAVKKIDDATLDQIITNMKAKSKKEGIYSEEEKF